MTRCQFVADLLAMLLVHNKSATSWQLPHLWESYREMHVMHFGHYYVVLGKKEQKYY